jgi:hypothetical protein
MRLDSPIALFLFNRPMMTAAVFERIARARPRRLLLVADGPKDESENAVCEAARAVVERVDWDCQVLRNYSDSNLGCRVRVASGLDWVFQECDQAIILEDDCVPCESFFHFCHDLLLHYRDDRRIMHVGGNNHQPAGWKCQDGYYFSKFPHIWGWATWRWAWQTYDVHLTEWPAFRDSGRLAQICPDPVEAEMWTNHFDIVAFEHFNTWDYQWTFNCWNNNALSIIPAVNLVSNIGYGPGATHTTKVDAFANRPTYELPFPLKHPKTMEASKAEDAYTFEEAFGGRRLRRKRAAG